MSYKLRHAKLRGVARFAAAVVASGVAVAGLLSPATAAAQPAVGSSEATRQGAWDTRNSLNSQAGTLPPDAAQAVQGAVDGAVNGMFPGLIQEREAAIRAENERRASCIRKGCMQLTSTRLLMQRGMYCRCFIAARKSGGHG